MTKKLPGLALVILILSLLFTACPQEFDPFGAVNPDGFHNFTGSVFGVARGFLADIRVDLTLEDGFIVAADIRKVSGRESPGWYEVPFNIAPGLIVARNSVELDTIAGATRTTLGIVNAGREALAKIPLPGALLMVENPGTYIQRAEGFGGPFYVSVTLSSTAITGINVEVSNESPAFGQPAIAILIDRMMEFQTSEVDGVSGATATSNALRFAVALALEEAGAPWTMTARPPGADDSGNRPANPQITVDVLVIGSGAAGLSAAIAAASEPSFPPISVILIEKQELIGGSTILSSGIIYAPEIETDRDAFISYFEYRAQGHANRSLLTLFADESWNLINAQGTWSGILPHFSQGISIGMTSRNRARPFPGGSLALVRTLENRARERGVTILTGVEATGLVRNSTGEVVRVLAESRTSDFIFNARRGVVIATGGFDNDRGTGSLMATHNTESLNSIPRSSRGNVGQGIRMGEAIGAETVFKGGMFGSVAIDPTIDLDISDVVNGHNIIFVTDRGESGFIDLSPPSGGTFTDANGTTHTLDPVQWGNASHDMIALAERTDPSVIFTGLMRILNENPGSQFFQISNTPFPRRGHVTHESLGRNGLAFHSMSFAGLAIAMWHGTIDSADIQSAFTARGWGDLPEGFFVWRIRPVSIGSMGGLKIDTQARVLGSGEHGTTPNQPIPGLFAAGEVANGDFFFRQNPALGSSLGIALTFGRIAGREAAGSSPRQLLP